MSTNEYKEYFKKFHINNMVKDIFMKLPFAKNELQRLYYKSNLIKNQFLFELVKDRMIENIPKSMYYELKSFLRL